MYRLIRPRHPVAVCDNIRINRCRIVQNELYRGAGVVETTLFRRRSGTEIMATTDGIPLEFCIMPGSVSDLQGIAELALDLPLMAELFVDGGYNFYEWEDYLQESGQIDLQVPRRRNSKRGCQPWLELYKRQIRKYIETTIGEITKLFPKKIHATNLSGFLLKIALFLFAYQIDKAFI